MAWLSGANDRKGREQHLGLQEQAFEVEQLLRGQVQEAQERAVPGEALIKTLRTELETRAAECRQLRTEAEAQTADLQRLQA